jgi:hypothetical protein
MHSSRLVIHPRASVENHAPNASIKRARKRLGLRSRPDHEGHWFTYKPEGGAKPEPPFHPWVKYSPNTE